jgi:hypothetical protein
MLNTSINVQTFHTFHNATAARDYRRANGTGGWILENEVTGSATLFPLCMTPSAIFRHPMARGVSGHLIGHG